MVSTWGGKQGLNSCLTRSGLVLKCNADPMGASLGGKTPKLIWTSIGMQVLWLPHEVENQVVNACLRNIGPILKEQSVIAGSATPPIFQEVPIQSAFRRSQKRAFPQPLSVGIFQLRGRKAVQKAAKRCEVAFCLWRRSKNRRCFKLHSVSAGQCRY